MDILYVETYDDQNSVVGKYGYTERLEYADQKSVVDRYGYTVRLDIWWPK